MSVVSDLSDRTAKVLRAHYTTETFTPPDSLELLCLCGERFDGPGPWAAHVASVLEAELGLPTELTAIYAPCDVAEDGTMQPRWHEFYEDPYQGLKAAQAEQRHLGRAWVSAWAPTAEETGDE